MIKLLVTSFYNTLINKEDAIPMSTMLELDRVRKKRVSFVVTTNRLNDEVLYYNQDYPFIDYIISLNGNYIYDVENSVCLYKNPLDEGTINEIEKRYSNHTILYYTENKYYLKRPKEKIYKIEIKLKRKELSNENELDDLGIKTSILKIGRGYFLEITNHSTYEGIIKLSEMISIFNDEIASIVGNESELEVVENLKNTYIVSNSPKCLKDKTKNRTKSNNAKGVEYLLKKLF